MHSPVGWRFSPGRDAPDGFWRDEGERRGNSPRRPRRCGAAPAGARTGGFGAGGSAERGGGHDGRGSRRAAGRQQPPREKSFRGRREAPKRNSGSSKTPPGGSGCVDGTPSPASVLQRAHPTGGA